MTGPFREAARTDDCRARISLLESTRKRNLRIERVVQVQRERRMRQDGWGPILDVSLGVKPATARRRGLC
jgi:hypothetical protein